MAENENSKVGWKRRFLTGSVKRGLRYAAWTLFGGTVMFVIAAVMFLNSKPDLSVWHEARLSEEFKESRNLESFGDYLALEDKLFKELEDKVYDEVGATDAVSLNRYSRGSIADPLRWPTNWNRSFELSAPDARVGVLALHGMSDSPYSMRSIGQKLHASGAWVVGLRIPGHGTAPSGLLKTKWEDMDAAVRLAMKHLQEKLPGKPIYIVGYSNGGALAVQYALETLNDGSLPKAAGLVLMSPEIGITPVAALAVWQSRLGHVLGLKKLAWNSVLPEYEPFKYGSFALNAAVQARRLTVEIRKRLEKAAEAGGLDEFPPVLAFQSAVDATVAASALVEVLFNSLPENRHEMVLFDLNRTAEVEALLSTDLSSAHNAITSNKARSFTYTLITNHDERTQEVVSKIWPIGSGDPQVADLGLSWPHRVFSLSHVALPFPESDPVYGGPNADESPGIAVGDVTLRGERGVLQVPMGALMRLRWNPFYPYIERRAVEFVGLGESGTTP